MTIYNTPLEIIFETNKSWMLGWEQELYDLFVEFVQKFL